MSDFARNVVCSQYIKPSKNHYQIYSENETQNGIPTCEYWENGSNSPEDIEDFHSCDRYKTVSKIFSGICVGVTTLCTRLNAEWFDNDLGECGFRTYCDQPKKFGVVYYADNKKRIVPIEKMTTERRNST